MKATDEIVIVGGGPAGVATALFLLAARPAWRGRVVILEKERYPREKFCAGAVGARADKLLATIGVRVDVPSVPVDGMSVALAGGTARRSVGRIGRVVRRAEFDAAFAEEARARGVRLMEGTRVEGIAPRAGSVRVDTEAGPLDAAVVVGADGVGSVVRRALGLPFGGLKALAAEVDTEPVEADPPRDLLHFDATDPSLRGYAWDFPTLVDGRPMVCRGVYALGGGDVVGRLRARLAALGLDLARHRLKRMAERGFEARAAASAPRVLLAGEAAGIDGLTGEGIAQAVEYGAVAGRYLAAKLDAGDVGFTDWRRHLALTPLGADLLARRALIPLCMGAARGAMERSLLAAPHALDVTTSLFAGRAPPLRSVARETAAMVRRAVLGAAV